MKLFAVLLGALALVAGFTGGMRAYSTAAHAGPLVPTAHIAVHHYPPAQVVRPGPLVKWAPCMKPAVRVGRACVTHVTRIVTRAAPVVTTPPATTSTAPVPRHSQPPQRPTDDGGHHDDGGHDYGGGHDA